MAAVMNPQIGETPLFTCLSCSIGFTSAEEQRVHYKSDHHRYNMKRRVAELPPVSVIVFNQKVLDRRQETAIMASSKGSVCDVCSKTYTTENAYRSHINSKKHKDNELRAAQKGRDSSALEAPSTEEKDVSPSNDEEPTMEDAAGPSHPILTVDADATEEDIAKTIDEKIAAARSRLSPQHCLFCADLSPTLEANLLHMSSAHSFFVPDAEYLVDLTGLITYLGEKIAVGNVCIFCNAKSREFRTLDAVRKHMLDKSHCKIAYDSERDRLEISDYYDFTASYPEHSQRKKKSRKMNVIKATADGGGEGEANEEWEDVEDDDAEVDEVVDEDATSASSSEDESVADGNELTYGDSSYELVLPSGARIGHRSLRRYYAQSFPRTSLATRNGKVEDPDSGAALVRRLLADKNSALVPRKGGFGAYGSGTDVVKARNRGEAREAGRHVREFRDQRRREDFKTRVGYRNNHQKHFRDPLLQ